MERTVPAEAKTAGGRREAQAADREQDAGTIAAMNTDTADEARISGQAEDSEQAWAMQLVVRASDEASDEEICESVARACVQLISSAGQSEQVLHAVRQWQSGRIRKSVRRAKNDSGWQRALDADTHAQIARSPHVQAAALTPTRTDAIPADVRRLQVSGLDRARAEHREPANAQAVHVWVNPDVPMSTGKAAAQCAHAAHFAWMQMDEEARAAWAQAGWPVRVTRDETEEWPARVASADIEVFDAGFTEVPAGTRTAIARLPRD